LTDTPQLSQVSQKLSLCAVGANDIGYDSVNVLVELTHGGICFEPIIDINNAFLHQDSTVDRGDVSDNLITLPFVLSGSESSLVSGDLSEVSLVSNNLLDVSVESGNLLDLYHASGLEPCIFSPSQVVRDLVETETVSDLSALMSDDTCRAGLINSVFARMSSES
jgi:hypothetical protein